MRTTVTLPPHLHEYVRELAHQQHTSMSNVVVQLLERSRVSGGNEADDIERAERGFPTLSVGRTVTSEDVRSLDDE